LLQPSGEFLGLTKAYEPKRPGATTIRFIEGTSFISVFITATIDSTNSSGADWHASAQLPYTLCKRAA
jgi:hypothetical protein